MNSNIRKTKRNLTIAFSVIIFIVIFILGVTFFSVKYFKEVRAEKNEFSHLIRQVENGKLSIHDIMNFGSEYRDDFLAGKRNKEHFKVSSPGLNFRSRGFMNYLYIDSSSIIISSNIRDEIDSDFIISIYKHDSYFKLQQESGFLVKKFIVNKNDGIFVIVKKITYSISDYMNDVLGFLFINLLFSLILYFIGLKFVNKSFIPVEDNLKDMKDFIHNAGHELKTPISVIDSNIQLMDDMKVYDANMTKELKQEVLRLNSIIEGLIKLSNIDVFKDVVTNNLKDSIEGTIKDFKFKISDKNLKIKIDIPESININANKDYFYIFISNIIGNAIKYNNSNGHIEVSYKNGELIIADSGIGIDEKDVGKIFDRFFKSDRSRESDGFGIGLSLVKKISEIYKWNIKVDSKKNKGTRFIIKLG
ncbi:HAMP domain-containing histidine kinase [Candidatus Gracilibacteria bacterium 28_42_T64]|nr:HAMP domain-containing histidine kinase [Candidatus Gracilibacteria bacterium 28_42_T64]